MRLKTEGLIKVKSEFEPNITTVHEVIKLTGITRQGIEASKLTFGIVEKLNKKVIIIDDKFHEFMNKFK